MAVFHWVEMDVINVAIEVVFVFNGVLPVALLPERFGGRSNVGRNSLRAFGEIGFDQAPW